MRTILRRFVHCAGWLAAVTGFCESRAACATSAAAEPLAVPITFMALEKTPYFVMVRDTNGSLIRCIASASGPSGRRTVLWDGRDSAGQDAANGAYRVFLSKGITWELDPGFGKAGRLGRHLTETIVQDPKKPIPVSGVLDRLAFSGVRNSAYPDLYPTRTWPVSVWIERLTVNGNVYSRVNEFTGPDASFVFRNGGVTLNPAMCHRGDTVKVISYDTCFLNNPWDAAVGNDGSLYVLLRWGPTAATGSTLIKLTADGRHVGDSFGVHGEIPFLFASHQVVLAPEENRIYIAGSHSTGINGASCGTGSFRMNSGAFWFFIGGSSDSPSPTFRPSGICLGKDNKIYLSDLKVFDRTKPANEGFLYGTRAPTDAIRPGPSMEKAPEDGMFYRTGWSSGIAKMKDTGSDIREVYSLRWPHKVIGVSLDPRRRLLFAAARETGGVVSVFYDDGASLQEVARLQDNALGGIHTVRYHDRYLYVVEDATAFSEDGSSAIDSVRKPAIPTGNNRISRYKLAFGREQKLAEVQKKPE